MFGVCFGFGVAGRLRRLLLAAPLCLMACGDSSDNLAGTAPIPDAASDTSFAFPVSSGGLGVENPAAEIGVSSSSAEGPSSSWRPFSDGQSSLGAQYSLSVGSSSSEGIVETVNSLWVDPPDTPLPNNGIPYLRITMADTSTMDSSVYSLCAIEIAGNGAYGDLPASNAKIRLRGNSTRLWYDKKPYRIKFETKTAVLGLAANKDWVLLANYRDQSKFMNAVAFDMARYMGNFAFVNANRFVEVEINGDYKGVYQLTEQIERASSRVNIGNAGVLLSLDKDDGPEFSPTATNNFYSEVYGMPVAVKSRKDISADQLKNIAADFAVLEQAIASADYDSVQKLLDVASFIDFVLLQELVRNVELEAPRSMYLYKDDAGMYRFGPVWDFDGGFGYGWDEESKEYFTSQSWILGSANPSTSPYNCVAANRNDWGMCNVAGDMGFSRGSFGQNNYDGYAVPGFFVNLFGNGRFLADYRARIGELQSGILADVFGKLDGYAAVAATALENDAVRWPPVRAYSTEIESLKRWLTERLDAYSRIVEAY